MFVYYLNIGELVSNGKWQQVFFFWKRRRRNLLGLLTRRSIPLVGDGCRVSVRMTARPTPFRLTDRSTGSIWIGGHSACVAIVINYFQKGIIIAIMVKSNTSTRSCDWVFFFLNLHWLVTPLFVIDWFHYLAHIIAQLNNNVSLTKVNQLKNLEDPNPSFIFF